MSTAAKSIASVLPKDGSCTPRVLGQQEVHETIGRLESIRQKLNADEEAAAADLHRMAAPVVAKILDGFGKDEAAASLLRRSKQEISDRRNGLRGTSAWELFALMAASQAAFLELARVFCELHGLGLPQARQRVTREQLAVMALEAMASGPLLQLLVAEAVRRLGASEQDVVAALAR